MRQTYKGWGDTLPSEAFPLRPTLKQLGFLLGLLVTFGTDMDQILFWTTAHISLPRARAFADLTVWQPQHGDFYKLSGNL